MAASTYVSPAPYPLRSRRHMTHEAILAVQIATVATKRSSVADTTTTSLRTLALVTDHTVSTAINVTVIVISRFPSGNHNTTAHRASCSYCIRHLRKLTPYVFAIMCGQLYSIALTKPELVLLAAQSPAQII